MATGYYWCRICCRGRNLSIKRDKTVAMTCFGGVTHPPHPSREMDFLGTHERGGYDDYQLLVALNQPKGDGAMGQPENLADHVFTFGPFRGLHMQDIDKKALHEWAMSEPIGKVTKSMVLHYLKTCEEGESGEPPAPPQPPEGHRRVAETPEKEERITEEDVMVPPTPEPKAQAPKATSKPKAAAKAK